MSKIDISLLKQRKVNITTEFMFQLGYQLNQAIFMFWTKFAQKGYIWSKTRKMNIAIEFDIYVIYCRLSTKFHLMQTRVFPNRVFLVSNRKSEHHHPIQNICIGLSTKFQLKQNILIFWIEFAQKGHFQSKTEKVWMTSNFITFELV